MTDGRATLGILYPGYSAEDDYPTLATMLTPAPDIRVVHTSIGEDAHRGDALRDIGSGARLREGAQDPKLSGVDAVMWACTSGSFVFGLEGARRQVAALREQLGVPMSSTSLAFVDAARALEVRRAAVAATYPMDVTAMFTSFLEEAGIEVVHTGSLGIITGEEVGTLSRERVLDLATANDHRNADVVMLPDTALHTVRWLDELEAALGKPVLTANQVTVWKALRLAGDIVPQEGLGSLFRRGAPVAGIQGSR